MIRTQAEAQELAIDTLLEHSTSFNPLDDYEIVRAFRVDDKGFMFVALRGFDWFGAVTLVVPDSAEFVSDVMLSHKAMNHWTSTEELDLVASLSAAYNPSQPRNPKGTSGGGQWKKSGQGILPGTESVRRITPEEQRFTTIAETTSALSMLGTVEEAGYSEGDPEHEAALAEIDKGFTARADSVLAPHGLHVEGSATGDYNYMLTTDYTIYEGDIAVGKIERNFSLSDGEVENAYFTLKPHLQGKGIATDMAATLEPWYAQNGINRITVHANIDVGGYTWAMQGFEFSDPYEGHSLAAKLLENYVEYGGQDTTLLDRLRVAAKDLGGDSWYSTNNLIRYDHENVLDTLWRTAADWDLTYVADEIQAFRDDPDSELTPDEVISWTSQFDGAVEWDDPEIESLLSWADSSYDNPPSPWDLATYGMPVFDDKKDKSAMWPGKEIMLGSDWNGVKDIYGY